MSNSILYSWQHIHVFSSIFFISVLHLVPLIKIAEGMPDRNGKHGEALCAGHVPDLEWIAPETIGTGGTEV